MSKTKSTILAIGAAGKFASLVVPELPKRGAKVRGLIRDEKQGKSVIKSGAADLAVGEPRVSVQIAKPGWLETRKAAGRSVAEQSVLPNEYKRA
jgi:hypothetical protein